MKLDFSKVVKKYQKVLRQIDEFIEACDEQEKITQQCIEAENEKLKHVEAQRARAQKARKPFQELAGEE